MTGILTSILTGVAVSFIVFFVTRHYSERQARKAAETERKEHQRLAEEKKNSDTIKCMAALTKAVAQCKIVTLGEQYIAQGTVTTEEKSIIQEMYEPYHELGGNSVASNIIKEVEKLPVVVEE